VTRLEERYRFVLRLLPAPYRAAWEQEMVAAFLESMATDDPEDADYLADYGRPSWSEMASVVALAVRLRMPAVRLRLGAPGAPPRYAAWGEGVRRAALAMLLVHAVLATVGLGMMLWLAGAVPWVPQAPVEWTQPMLSNRWQVTYTLLASAWVLAYLALLLGYRRAARWCASVAVAGAVLDAIVRVVLGVASAPATMLANLLLDGLLLVALLAFHRDAPAVRPRPWLVSLGAGIAVATGFVWLTQGPIDERFEPLVDWAGVCSILLVGVAVPYLLGVLVRPAGRASPWSLAFALLACAVVALRLVTLPDLPPGAAGVGLAEAAVVAAVGVPLAELAARALRRLSPVSAGLGGGSLG
jgi:hypothetical protein